MKMKGHCLITDGTNIILDQHNDIHPGNMSQIISRALANDSNYWINSIAFGDGGCDFIQNEYIPRTPNDGLIYTTWDDKLYNETYRIYLDQVDIEYNNGYGINDFNNPLENLEASLHPTYSRFNRNKQGVVSFIENGQVKVEILVQLKDIPLDGTFTFSEIALFSGYTLPKKSTVQRVNYTRTTEGQTFFTCNFNEVTKTFDINVVKLATQLNEILSKYNTEVYHEILFSFSTTIDLKAIKINDILKELNFDSIIENKVTEILVTTKQDNINELYSKLAEFTSVQIIDRYLVFKSKTDFSISRRPNDLFDKMWVYIDPPIVTEITSNYDLESSRTDKNNPLNPEKEASRLLTHLTFEPIDKPKISNYYLIYTLTIDVAPTPYQEHIDFVIPNEYRLSNTYEYNTVYPLKEWIIYHQLGFMPKKIQVFVDNKLFVDYSISYGDQNNTENSATNQLTIIFDKPTIGTARLE